MNYSEDSVGTYTLPDVLTLQNGKKVNDAKTWTEKRRPEIVNLFEEHQFGKMPSKPADMTFKVFYKGTEVLGAKAIRKQVTVYFTKDTSDHKMDLLTLGLSRVKYGQGMVKKYLHHNQELLVRLM